MKVRCNKRDIQGCFKTECYHYDWHTKDLDCDDIIECALSNCEIIDVKCISKPDKWSDDELYFLHDLAYLEFFNPSNTLHLQWQDIAYLINKYFNTNRTAESCRKKFARGQ